MITRLSALACILLLGLVIMGCDPPPTCDASLKRLTTINNYPTNVFKQVIPANPTVASNSAAIISRQVFGLGAQTEVRISMGGWSHPVFYTGSAQSKNQYITLQRWDGTPSWYGSTRCGPMRWRSCISGGTQADGHCTVIDEVDGCVNSFWGLRMDSYYGTTAASASGMPFTDASGVFEPGEGLGSNAGGANVYVSSVWPDECTSGFDHGFMFATGWNVNNPTQISKPFYHTDGSGTHADDLFQGMRVQLNPAYDISGLPLYKNTIAQAMKTYGMYDGNSSDKWLVYGINKTGYTNNPWVGVLPDPDVDGFTVVPIAQFRVLAPNWTDERTSRANNSCITYYGAYQGVDPSPAPTLTNMSPASGSASGGTSVTLTGTNFGIPGTPAFDPALPVKVRFGMTDATNLVVVSTTQIRCTSPAGSGAVPVTVLQEGCSNAMTYTYSGGGSAPTLSSLAPTSGTTAGGTSVTLTGTNLTGTTAVSFGGTAATGIVVDSSTSVRCTSPAKSAGAISVTATTANGTSNGVDYTYTSGGGSYTATLYSPHDSYVVSSSANNNYGTTNMVIQKNATKEYAAYIKFDLNTVQGATITNAKLRLNFWTTATAVTKVYSCTTNDAWIETGTGAITWNNKPAWGTQQASFTSPNNNWVEVDVTSYINSNFNGDKLVTLVISDDQTLNVNIQAYSDETGAATSKRPELVVISQ